jgi:hypothetical protein
MNELSDPWIAGVFIVITMVSVVMLRFTVGSLLYVRIEHMTEDA